MKTGEEVCRFKDSEDQITDLAFTPNGKYLLGAGRPRNGIRVWDTATGKEIRRFKDCEPEFAVLAGGATVALNQIEASGRRVISLRRMDSGEEIHRLTGHQGGFGVHFCCPNDKTLLSFGADLRLRRWDTETGEELTRRHNLDDAPQDAINFVAFSPDGKTVLSADCGLEQSTIRVWDPIAAVEKRRWTDQRDFYGTRVLSSDGKTFAVVAPTGSRQEHHSRIRLVSVSTGKEQRSLVSADDWIGHPCFSPDGKTLFASAGKTLRTWDIASGKESRPAVTNKRWGVVAMACSPDGQTLALAHNLSGLRETTALTLLDLTQRQKEKTIHDSFEVYQSLAFSPDGRYLAVGGRHERVYLFDVTSAKSVREFPGAGGCLAFSPDGRLLATSGWGSSTIYATGAPLASTVCVWEVSTGQQRCRFTGHLDPVQALAFSPDGRLLVSGSLDTSLLVWDVLGVARSDPSRKMSACWDDLGTEGEGAHRAIGDLVAAGDRAVAFFQKCFPLLSPQDKKHIAELIAALDHERFAQREKATKELATLGAAAVPDLLRTLEGQLSPEVRRRVEQLVEKPRREEKELSSAPALRTLRAIEVLEHIGNPLAQRILRDLSERGPGVLCRHEAREALHRLTQKVPSAP